MVLIHLIHTKKMKEKSFFRGIEKRIYFTCRRSNVTRNRSVNDLAKSG
jgi:hypothetical protein